MNRLFFPTRSDSEDEIAKKKLNLRHLAELKVI